MASGSRDTGVGLATSMGDDAQSADADPWEVPLYVIPKKGRPSNWAKKFAPDQADAAAQQTKERAAQTLKNRRASNRAQLDKPAPDPAKEPAPAKKRGLKPRAAKKYTGGIYTEESLDLDDELPERQDETTTTPKESPPSVPQPVATVEKDGEIVVSDTDSLFNGDADDLYPDADRAEKTAEAPQVEDDSLFVDDDEPVRPKRAAPLLRNRFGSKWLGSPEPEVGAELEFKPVHQHVPEPRKALLEKARPQPSPHLSHRGSSGLQSVSPVDTPRTECAQEVSRISPAPSSHVPARLSQNPFSDGSGQGFVKPEVLQLTNGFGPAHSFRASAPPTINGPSQPIYYAPDRAYSADLRPGIRPDSDQLRNCTNTIDMKLAAMTEEVRRWEAVTSQVVSETKAMSALVHNLAQSASSAQSPSATVRGMLSPDDQAKFRDQLLRATQLSLKADLVKTLRERDSEGRWLVFGGVVVAALAIVVAAFLVSPFAEWAVEVAGRRGWV